jgi:recombination protein RecA
VQRRTGSRTSQNRGLAKAVAGIEKKFGVGALQRLGDLPRTSIDALPTGIDELDRVLGIGGWPRGRICEIFGSEGVGVTTLLLHSVAAAQQRGGIVAFVDVDHAFVPEYARRIGCIVEEIFIAQPDDGPMALEIVDALVRSGAFDLVVLDSVPGLYSASRDNQVSDGAGEALARARLLSEAMRRLAANIDRTRTVVLFGNRLVSQSAEDDDPRTPGGRALRFYSSIRLALQRGLLVEDALGVAGITITVTTAKNKVAPPLRKAELRLVYGQGFAEAMDVPPNQPAA